MHGRIRARFLVETIEGCKRTLLSYAVIQRLNSIFKAHMPKSG